MLHVVLSAALAAGKSQLDVRLSELTHTVEAMGTCLDLDHPKFDDLLKCECHAEKYDGCAKMDIECIKKSACDWKDVCDHWKQANCHATTASSIPPAVSRSSTGEPVDVDDATLAKQLEGTPFASVKSCATVAMAERCDHPLATKYCPKSCAKQVVREAHSVTSMKGGDTCD